MFMIKIQKNYRILPSSKHHFLPPSRRIPPSTDSFIIPETDSLNERHSRLSIAINDRPSRALEHVH